MNARHAAGEQTRKNLIDAAICLIRRQGANALTLEAVAREAGVSKGGLLHHFHSKEILIEAILHQLCADFASVVDHFVAQEPDTAGRWLRAYVRASFSEQPLPVELATLLFSAFVENPALRSFLQEDDARWQQRILSDGLSAPRATIVRQAADACWMDWLSGVDSVAPDDLRDELLSLAEAQP